MIKWKNDAPYVLCISHDVDRVKKQWYHYLYYGLKHPFVQIRSFLTKISGKEPYWNFDELIELESKYNSRSTFFFLNESRRELSANFMGRYDITSDRIRNIIKKLDQEGFEIGLHGSFDSYNNLNLLKKEKEILESIVGHPVISTRQHHLNFQKEVTWKIQNGIGIKYDSTLGYSNQVGKELFFRTSEGLIEIPITIMDTVEMDENVYKQCCEQADNGGVVMINFHQCHFNKIEYPKNVDIYIRLLDKAKKDGAWIARVKDVGEWIDNHMG